MIIKQNGKYITVSIGLYMGINILNKEARIQFIKQINEYIMKNIMKNAKKRSAQYVRKTGLGHYKMILLLYLSFLFIEK